VKKLSFSISVRAPRDLVWRKMLEQDSYRQWTTPFTEGSYYEGSWEKGASIRFLSPGGDGMRAEIAESRRPEFVSIRHLGLISHGVDDTESPAARAWVPAYENYTFTEKDGTTTVVVEADSTEEFAGMFCTMWPLALQRLKEICEA
jgi:uncharacterized protein YndB with AHSA1/START domain